VSIGAYIVFYVILLGCGVVCFVKGKFVFTVLGVLLPIFWIVGAVRPAKPDSRWTKHFPPTAPTPLR
jgi:hypothetical protein